MAEKSNKPEKPAKPEGHAKRVHSALDEMSKRVRGAELKKRRNLFVAERRAAAARAGVTARAVVQGAGGKAQGRRRAKVPGNRRASD